MSKPPLHDHMNSQAIQSRHRKLYEELFHACPTVASAPAVLQWSPTYAVGPGGIGITSKLPLRLYGGFEPTTNGKLEYGPIRYYLPEKDEFVDWDMSRANPLILNLLEHETRRLGKRASGRFWCLSEIPWYRGLNVDPLVGVGWAGTFLVHLGVVTPEEALSFAALPSERLRGNAAFEKIFRLASAIESLIAHVLSDGHMIFEMLVDARYPTVFFRERDPFLFDHYRDFGLDHPGSYYNAFNGLFYRGARLEELFPLDPDPAWPLDVALLHISEEGDSQFVYKTRGAFKSTLEGVAAFAATTLSPLVPETFRETPQFLDLAKGSPASSAGMNLMQVYRKTSVAHSMTVLKTTHDLFQYGAAPHTLREFIEAQNLCQDILRILGLSSLSVDRACTALRTAGMRRSEAGVAARLAGQGMFGCLSVIGPRYQLEACITEAMAEHSGESAKPIHCHWASWRDGNSERAGMRVEQHVASGCYAPGTSGKSLTVWEWKNGAAAEVMLMTADRFEEEQKSFDLLLDARLGKVFLRGQALTSDDIHSAKQTIELFRQFFTASKTDIPAAELPESIYRSDRNQMESKIVRPLLNTVKERTGKNLGLEIHGGLRSNYTVSFRPDAALRIGFVEKI